MEKKVEYFPHAKDMRHDPRILAIRRKFSLKGYAIWCMLLESLCDSDSRSIVWDGVHQEILACDFGVSTETLRDFVKYCITMELIQIEDNEISCCRFDKNFVNLDQKREAGRRGAEARWGQNPNRMAQNGETMAEMATASSAILSPDGNKNKSKNKNISSFYNPSSLIGASSDPKEEIEKSKEKIVFEFFKRNWAAPNKEFSTKFWPWYNQDDRDWASMSAKQRQKAVAEWEQRPSQRDRFDYDFLQSWSQLVSQMFESNAPASILRLALDDKLSWKETETSCTLRCSGDLKNYLESDDNLELLKTLMTPYRSQGKKLFYDTY